MNIAIAPFPAAFLPFFVNLAKYLEALGNKVLFLNPDYYEIVVLSKCNFNINTYPKTSSFVNKYDSNSAIVLYLSRLYQLKETAKLIKHKNHAYSRAYSF
ncbi:MAG: hypothetical protein IPO21_01970 [Bacteroidales bacterium]|nr:hypothetical protein [Bacteroidales bacterium]